MLLPRSIASRWQWDSAVALALASIGVALRALSRPPLVSDVDAVNFARSLARFDPLAQAPHFPGYPVYVAAARPFAALPETWALILPALLLWPVAMLALHVGLRRHFGAGPALGAVCVASLAPGAALIGGRPGSDGLGTALLYLALGLLLGARGPSQLHQTERAASARPRWALLAAALLGLVLGVRLSWAALVGGLLLLGLVWVCRGHRERLYMLSCFGLGCLVWLLPQLALVGLGPLLELGQVFVLGHMSSWGGTLVAEEAGLATRMLRGLWNLWAAGLGGMWPGRVPLAERDGGIGLARTLLSALIASTALLGAAGLLAARRPLRGGRLLALLGLSLVPYAIYALLAQNIEKPRHLLVLLPLGGALLGAVHLHRRFPVWLPLAAALLAVALPRALEQRSGHPALHLLQQVQRDFRPAGVQLFAGEEARLFEHHLPMYRVWRNADLGVLQREACSAEQRGAQVLVSSGANGAAQIPEQLTEVGRYRGDPAVFAHDSELVLFRFRC